MRARAIALIAPLLIGAAPSPELVPDVSERAIEIRYSFTGAELLLFGAIVYPGGRRPREQVDIAVVLKGPTESIVLREKRKVAGIWVNADSTRFRSAPGYYAVASSRPIREMIDDRTAAIYELGLDNIQMSPASGAEIGDQRRFQAGLVDLRRRTGLYLEDPRGVEISEGVLYRARIRIPARVPVGKYTAETFLIEDGQVVAAAVRPVDIDKSGFERFVTIAAQRWSVVYGLSAVAMSLVLGWAGAALFRRRGT
ncbi:TIGR02186 family protein [Sphingomonas quercus]|uniref:TIGR02186 family protein n=1 Tax=Sphingomonas quercus TaxID=2842451 RepID=UPI003426CD16